MTKRNFSDSDLLDKAEDLFNADINDDLSLYLRGFIKSERDMMDRLASARQRALSNAYASLNQDAQEDREIMRAEAG